MNSIEHGAPAMVAGRYVIGQTLGSGGIAFVCQAKDLVSGREVALKRLLPDQDLDAVRKKHTLELFEREFHTLSQLKHPNVVAAYDFGVDASVPYYTMELLQGGDLVDRAPLDWRMTCSLAKDVCSALSLIHSRRLVYRDLSPRNVRCSDGTAKLLDFGAVTAMGPTKFFVGTLAISAPEAINVQPLDARADLYSLGATLYYGLTGRHAFPARTFEHLLQLWSSTPPPPSAIATDVPEALDALVMQLLDVNAAHRPVSAGEVTERLSAITGTSMDESNVVSSAYLVTPTLVGRQVALDQVQQRLHDALRKHGGSVFVQGPAGCGRSRFLDACMLTAKTSGALVVRTDASDAAGGEYDALRAVAGQLLMTHADEARAAASAVGPLVGGVIPTLHTGNGPRIASLDLSEQQAPVRRALRDWLLEMARNHTLVVAVDDVHGMDISSVAVFALLSRAAADRSLLLVTTACKETDAMLSPAVKFLADASLHVRLARLTKADSETMLRSVFGNVPNLTHLARHLHEVSNGLPRDIMLLAQHLVDSGGASYLGGTWSLPETRDVGDLPKTLANAIQMRVDALALGARELVRGMALAPDTRYSLHECVRLVEGGSVREVMSRLDELVSADLVSAAGADYLLARKGMHVAILVGIDPELQRMLQLRLAALFETRNANAAVVVPHLINAGANDRALDLLLSDIDDAIDLHATNPDAFNALILSLPASWQGKRAIGVLSSATT